MRTSGTLFAALVWLGAASHVLADNKPTAPPSEVAGRTLSQWMAELKHPDPSNREEAIRAITLFGPASSEVVTVLLDRCMDRDMSPKVRAVQALAVMELRKEDVPRVIEGLDRRLKEDTQVEVRYQAACALLRFGTGMRMALDGLCAGVQDSSWEVRHVCVLALPAAGQTDSGPDPRATRALLAGLRDGASKVRVDAAVGLGAMGKPANSVMLLEVERGLQATMTDRDRSVAVWSVVSLTLLDRPIDGGLNLVGKALTHSDQRVRLHAARAAAVLGPKAIKHCVPGLLEMLKSRDPAEIVMACAALGEMGDPGEQASTALHDLIGDKNLDENLRKFAEETLKKIRKGKK
jgi:HEAT repeat protein